MSETPKKPVRQAIVDTFIEQLKNGTSVIGRPFAAGEVPPPINGVSGKPYSSVNRLILSEAGDDPRWLTKRQAEGLGYQVREEAEARRLIFWEYTREVPTYNPDGSPRLNNIGNQIVETVRLDRPMMRVYEVYHARDLATQEGQDVPPYEPPTENRDPLERTSAILAGSGASIRHDPSPNAAAYKIHYDLIILPDKSLVSEEEYCARAVKELVTWTGHPDRLNWLRKDVSSEAQYIQFNMQETMAGAMIAQDLGLKFEPDVDAGIIGHWVKNLEKDPEMFFRAATQAEKIHTYIMGLERTQDLEEERGERQYASQGFRPAGPDDKPERGAWIQAEGDQATVFAVVARDGSIVSTFGSPEAATIEAGALNMGVNPSLKYSGETLILDVPFEEKDMVKALGATWDQKNRAWCARPGVELTKLGAWLPANELRRSDLLEPNVSDRLVLDVPYKYRQEAKDLGAFFDPAQGAWVTSSRNKNLDELTRRFPPKAEREAAPEQVGEIAAVPEIATERVVLAVPYEEKDLAKAAGAKWDRTEKTWGAEPGTDLAKLSQWLPEREPEPEKVLAAAEEFAKALEKAGFQLDGLPKMDDKIYRVPITDGPPNNKDGAYYATMKAERPNGWLKNHQTGEYQAWIYSGQELSADSKELLKEEAQVKRQATEEKAEKIAMAKWAQGLDVAEEFATQIDGLVPTDELLKNPFLEVAGINAVGGVRRDDDGNLMVPGVNIEGRLQTVQTIRPNGEAHFEKGGNRAGVMCVIDGFEVISQKDQEIGLPVFRPEYTDHGDENLNNDLLIAEDYATGASLHTATGLPVVVAFSPDNLVKVASVIREKYPETNLLVCANNHPERANNLCLKKAGEAAKKVGGKLLVPTFNELEQGAGLATFNDLHKTSGLGAVRRAIDEARGRGAAQDAGFSR